MGNPYTAEWVMHILPTLGPAAELALQVLTGPGGGLAPNTTHPAYSIARQHAAMSVTLVGCCVKQWDVMIEAEAIRKAGPGSAKRGATREEAVVVSDIVQTAIILHCCVFIHACRQQQQQRGADAAAGSSSSSGVQTPPPAAAAAAAGHRQKPSSCCSSSVSQ
jgi:hypothetical protein